MRVLFLNPPYLGNYSRTQRSPQVTKSGTFYYPIWLAYAATTVEAAGHQIRLVDAPAARKSLEGCVALARELQPDLIAVDTSTPSIENDANVARALKEAIPQSVVCLVGPHVSATAHETLRAYPWVDFVAIEEYDYTLRDVANALAGGSREGWKGVPGLAYLEGSEVKALPRQEWIQDLDSIPFVSRTYKNHLNYEDYFYSITQWPVVTIISGRGCPYKCNYCMYPQTLHGHEYRTRSPENVVAEIEYIEKEFPRAREIFIEDDTLTLHRRRVVAICEEIIRRGLKIHWTCNARADVDLETLQAMKAANCRLLCVGIESGDQQILDNVGKGIRLEQIHQFFADVKKAGIMVHGCFMAGNRGETRETLEKTLALAKKLEPDTAQFFPLMVYPGTKAYEWARDEGLIQAQSWKEWLTEEGLHNTVVDRPDLPHAEVVRFCDRARREFYLRPSYVLRKLLQVILHPRELPRVARSFKTLVRYLLRK
jgi:radical SAM superfamily enzyme YgiQ (UPF0313 family)